MFAEPQVIADLGDNGRVRRQNGSSYTISSLGKRKRSEVVLATDSSGVGVYDARSSMSRNLTTHSMPPGERVLCPPVSVVVKYGGSRSQERYTYWATDCGRRTSRISDSLTKIKVTCLQECNNDTKTTSVILGSGKEPVGIIKCLEVVPSQEFDQTTGISHEVVAIHADFTIRRFSPDLQTTRLNTPLPLSPAQLDSTMSFATTVSLEEAQRTLLASREDLSIPSSTGIVVACIHGDEITDLKLSYFHINTRSAALFSLPIPGTDDLLPKKAQYYIHPKSAKLYELRPEYARSRISIYDIGGLNIRLDSSMEVPATESFARVSQHSVMACANDRVVTYDVKWKYVQETSTHFSKDEDAQMRLLSYFPSTSSALVNCGNTLFAYDAKDDVAVDGRASKKRRTGGLADAVGQGKHTYRSPAAEKESFEQVSQVLHRRLVPSSSGAIGEITRRFESLLEDANANAYDEAMLHALATVSTSRKGSSIGYAAQPDLVAYAIHGLFDLDGPMEKGIIHLKVRKMAPETFRFLLTHGLLTVAQVEKALRLVGRLGQHSRIHESSLVSALTRHDETLQALIFYLSSAPLLTTHELAAALLICLKTVRRLENKPELKAVEAPKAKPLANGDVSMTNGVDNSVATASDFDGEWPDPDPEEGITHNARSALGSCLTRLSLCYDKDIQKALRATMSATDILSLVDHIRMELSSGGWLARYLDEDLQGEEDLSAQTNQVNVAAKILNCAIDSLGAATWLLGSGTEVEASRSADKVAYMQAEINAALEGIENSAFLEQILHEVLLYAKTAEEAEKTNANPEIVQVPVGVDGKEIQMLPLGMKKDKVSRTRIASGGKEVTRTARDIGRLESKKVPEYSFERIMI